MPHLHFSSSNTLDKLILPYSLLRLKLLNPPDLRTFWQVCVHVIWQTCSLNRWEDQMSLSLTRDSDFLRELTSAPSNAVLTCQHRSSGYTLPQGRTAYPGCLPFSLVESISDLGSWPAAFGYGAMVLQVQRHAPAHVSGLSVCSFVKDPTIP